MVSTQDSKMSSHRPYAKLVGIHFFCLVKFLKMLMVTLENIWNNMLN